MSSINEPFFQGHFPDFPVMPGVLIIEANGHRLTGLLGFKTMDEQPSEDVLYLFVGADKARFKRQVMPGDVLTMHVKLIKRKRDIWKFDCEARVDGQLAASAIIMCAASKITPA